MKTTQKLCTSVWIAALSIASAIAQNKPASSTKANNASKPPVSTHAPSPAVAAQDPGERKFQANCSRCHDAPEQLSPRITGTVLRHMRVRALLSAEDERDILRYLAP
jgi:cytochrome c5